VIRKKNPRAIQIHVTLYKCKLENDHGDKDMIRQRRDVAKYLHCVSKEHSIIRKVYSNLNNFKNFLQKKKNHYVLSNIHTQKSTMIKVSCFSLESYYRNISL